MYNSFNVTASWYEKKYLFIRFGTGFNLRGNHQEKITQYAKE